MRRPLARSLSSIAAPLSIATALLTACPPRGQGTAREADGPARPTDARTLAVFDPAAVGPAPRPPPRPGAEAVALAVVDYGPVGLVDGKVEVHVRFNRAVVPLGDLKAPPPTLLTIEPPLAGEARWKSPDLLVFQPDAPPPPAHRFTARLTPGGPLAGIKGPIAWSFETPRPTVVDADPDPQWEPLLGAATRDGDDGDDDDDDGWGPWQLDDHRRTRPFTIDFNQAIDLAEARAHLRASARSWVTPGAAAIEVPITVRRRKKDEWRYDETCPECLVVVEPRGLWPVGSRVELTVTAGLRSTAGPLPIDGAWKTAFDTHGPQAIAGVSCGPQEPCDLEPLRLTLRNHVAPAELRKISVSPRPPHLRIYGDDSEWTREVTITGAFTPGIRYTIRVPEGLRDYFDQHLAGGATHEVVFEAKPSLELSSTSGVLSPGKAQTIGATSRQVAALALQVGVFTDAELAAVDPERAIDELAFPAKTIEQTIRLTPTGTTEWSDVALDLAALAGGSGRTVLVEARATKMSARARGQGLPKPVRGIYRLTDLGPVVTISQPASHVQVMRLSTGQPVPKARVMRADREAGGALISLGETDADGLLTLPPPLIEAHAFPSGGRFEPPDLRLIIVDPSRDDHASVDIGVQERWGSEAPLRPGERLLGGVVTERGVYRPGEKVRVFGWSALDTPFAPSNLGWLKAGTPVKFELVTYAPWGSEGGAIERVIAREEARVRADGRFWAALSIPAEAPLRPARVQVSSRYGSRSAPLLIEDYRVPEFSVDVRSERVELLERETTAIHVQARSTFGSPAPIQRLSRLILCRGVRYRPPGLEDMWLVGRRARDDESYAHRQEGGPGGNGAAFAEPLTADAAAGRHVLRAGGEPYLFGRGLPQRCTVEVAVQDASKQEVGGAASFLVHPASYYLALVPPQRVVESGERVRVPIRAVDPQGRRVAAAAVQVTITRTWKTRRKVKKGDEEAGDGWDEHTKEVGACTVDLRADGDDGACEVDVRGEGTYVLAAKGREAENKRVAITHVGFLARPKTAAPTTKPPPREPAAKGLTVTVDHPDVTPGEPVEVVVRGPWPGARGTLVLARSGVREVHPVVLANGEARLRFTSDDTWTPAVSAEATVIAPTPAGSRGVRPRVERAAATITQGYGHRRLRVHVDAPTEAGPRETIDLTIRVGDAEGRPSAARVALWAVDEAVLDLTGHTIPDLLPSLIPRAAARTFAVDDYRALLFPHVAGGDPWFAADETIGLGNTGLIGKGGGGGHGSSSAPTIRSRFETTPIYLADVNVDASGSAKVQATLPDNLTTFRITAIASAPLADGSGPGRIGQTDVRTVVTAPLVVRGALPRHLRPGDRAEIAAIVDNRGDLAGRVEVTAKMVDGTGPKGHVLKFISKPKASAEVAAGAQVRLAFEVEAVAAGAPALELTATLTRRGGGPRSDAVRLPLPIAAERTLRERVAVHGSVDDDGALAIPVQLPKDALASLGGVQVTLSATLLAGLEDAAQALIDYPHGCAEQTASRLLPLIAAASLKAAIGLEVDDPEAFIAAGVARLLSMQREGGGFAYWPEDKAAHPYASAYATWVLAQAEAAGRPVDPVALATAEDSLRKQLAAFDPTTVMAGRDQGPGAQAAFAALVLADAGRPEQRRALALFAVRQRLPLFARAFLLMALHRGDADAPEVAMLVGELAGAVIELPASAHTTAPIGDDDDHFTSEARSDAIVLLALLRAAPEHALVPKLARGLLARRVGGAWRTTQENAFALLALAAYARVAESTTPDLSARAWIGEQNLIDARLVGPDAGQRPAFTDMASLLHMTRRTDSPLPVTIQRLGQGRLYYRIAAEWAPAEVDLPARSQGLEITRTLRGRDGPIDGAAIAGEPLALDITVVSDAPVHYVAIDVPLPAGLEAISRTIGTRGRGAAILGGARGRWVAHEEQRPDRVVLFVDALDPGAHHHTIDLRATGRGRFQFPPSAAEAMYMPEVYGRSEGGRLEVR